MKKKTNEREAALRLRAEGRSLNFIADALGVSKGSVSAWVKDVSVATKKKAILTNNPHTSVAVEKRRASRLKSEKAKRDKVIEQSTSEVYGLTERELWLIGTSLYWAEGGKTQRMVRFSNGDPRMIQVMMRFFIEVCNVPKAEIKGYIHIHEHLDIEAAEKYWQKVSDLPAGQFYKTYRKKKTLSKRRTLPYGVLELYIMDTGLFLKLTGWTEGMYQHLNLTNKELGGKIT